MVEGIIMSDKKDNFKKTKSPVFLKKTTNTSIANATFFENLASRISKARKLVNRTADLSMCVTYFNVGRMIVDYEQMKTQWKVKIDDLAEYLSARLNRRFSKSTLKNARKFYLAYKDIISLRVM
jgi:hypothetical protein